MPTSLNNNSFYVIRWIDTLLKSNGKEYQALVVEFILLILLGYILVHIAQVNGFCLI